MTRRNFFEQDLDDQKKEEEEKLLLDNVSCNVHSGKFDFPIDFLYICMI